MILHSTSFTTLHTLSLCISVLCLSLCWPNVAAIMFSCCRLKVRRSDGASGPGSPLSPAQTRLTCKAAGDVTRLLGGGKRNGSQFEGQTTCCFHVWSFMQAHENRVSSLGINHHGSVPSGKACDEAVTSVHQRLQEQKTQSQNSGVTIYIKK